MVLWNSTLVTGSATVKTCWTITFLKDWRKNYKRRLIHLMRDALFGIKQRAENESCSHLVWSVAVARRLDNSQTQLLCFCFPFDRLIHIFIFTKQSICTWSVRKKKIVIKINDINKRRSQQRCTALLISTRLHIKINNRHTTWDVTNNRLQ